MTWVAAGVGIGSTVLGAVGGRKDRKRNDRLAANQAAYEADRDQRTALTRSHIDNIFDSPRRLKQRQSFATNLRGQLDSDLGRRRVDTQRDLKFALARGGQTGGKFAIDTNRRLGDEFAEAAIQNERTVAGEVAQLQGQDEQARNALKQLASTGMSLTDATRRAGVAQQNTLATADTAARARGLGDVFADTARTYKAINERAELRRGYGYNNRRADLYGGRA